MANQAQLILQAGAGTQATRWSLGGPVTTLGRWEGCEVVLSDPEVSRKHAQIRHEGGRYVLVDLGSKNGTLVNGVRAERAVVLADGDELVIAPRFRLRFVDSEATVSVDAGRQGLRIDAATRSVRVRGRLLEPPLAPSQLALLQLLCESPGRVYSRDEAAAVCYPDALGDVSDQAIDGVVRRLRARLAEVDPETDYVIVVRGHGLKLATPAPDVG